MSTKALSRREAIDRLRGAESRDPRNCRSSRGFVGSVLRVEAGPESYVDLLVEFEASEKTFDHFMGLALFLEDLLDHHVELLTTESLSPYIGPHILRAAEDVLFAA